MNKQLHQRILNAMPKIEAIIANENRGIGSGGECCDVRPAVVRCIQKIAELETTPPFRVLQVLNRVAKNARGLELSLHATPPSVQRQLGVDENFLTLLSKLVSQAPKAVSPPKTKRSEAAKTRRKRLAAETACNLLLDLGGNTPSLFADGSYIKLATLLYKTATGLKGDLEPACSKHFQSLKEDGLNLFARHLWSLGPTSPMPASLLPLAESARAEARQRRTEAAGRWQPLRQVVDDVLKE